MADWCCVKMQQNGRAGGRAGGRVACSCQMEARQSIKVERVARARERERETGANVRRPREGAAGDQTKAARGPAGRHLPSGHRRGAGPEETLGRHAHLDGDLDFKAAIRAPTRTATSAPAARSARLSRRAKQFATTGAPSYKSRPLALSACRGSPAEPSEQLPALRAGRVTS